MKTECSRMNLAEPSKHMYIYETKRAVLPIMMMIIMTMMMLNRDNIIYTSGICILELSMLGKWEDPGPAAEGYKLMEFDSQYGQEFSILHVIHNSSGAHPASCTISKGLLSPGKAAGAWSWQHLQLVLRSRNWSIHLLIHTSSWLNWTLIHEKARVFQRKLHLSWP
jgi:hypothetical protein